MTECVVEQAVNLKRTQGRINLIEIANSLGIDVYTTKEIKQSSFIAYDAETENYEIYLNENEVGTRQRFSIAHEIAHFVLHKNKIKTFGVVGRECEQSLSVAEEKEADTLAAEILMPTCICNEYLTNHSITMDTVIDYQIVKDFAKEFGVSILAAIVKLRELGYYVKYIEL